MTERVIETKTKPEQPSLNAIMPIAVKVATLTHSTRIATAMIEMYETNPPKLAGGPTRPGAQVRELLAARGVETPARYDVIELLDTAIRFDIADAAAEVTPSATDHAAVEQRITSRQLRQNVTLQFAYAGQLILDIETLVHARENTDDLTKAEYQATSDALDDAYHALAEVRARIDALATQVGKARVEPAVRPGLRVAVSRLRADALVARQGAISIG